MLLARAMPYIDATCACKYPIFMLRAREELPQIYFMTKQFTDHCVEYKNFIKYVQELSLSFP